MNSKKTKILVFLTLFSTTVYLIWRTLFTLPIGYGKWSMGFGLVMLIAELTGLFEQIVHFYNMSDKTVVERPKKLKDEYPTVDVFIATYNEPVELLYKTVNGCVHMDYPDKEKVNIYLCDDGGRKEVKELADKFGIGYFAREDHKGAKAGNLNNALNNSKGELVVTLDADMIPMSDFLMASVPYFMNAEEDNTEKIGFVQMPQNFYNLDLFQYNLYSENSIPNEQDYFYKDIELAKNKSNSVIYGGSNTVISRAALNEIGGFVTNVITEDFATGMMIQSKGYKCIAIDEVHASGLSPEDLKNLVSQRKRWARGCIQTGRKLNVLFKKGLSMSQKISYLSSISYWYSPMKRFIYMMAPILYALFGITVLIATPLQLILFWLPMYLLNAKALKWLSGNIRTVRWTNIYETIMYPLLLKEVLLESIGISEHHFSVTKKGGSDEASTKHLKMATPHILLAVLTFLGILRCIHVVFTSGNVSILFLVFWLSSNLYNLSMAILFMLGRETYRKHERFKIEAEAVIEYEKRTIVGKTVDISEGGVSVTVDRPEYMPPEEIAKITLRTEKYETTFHAKIVFVLDGQNGYRYSFQLTDIEEMEYRNLLLILHDRVPPLVHKIKKEYGFFEDLRINVVKRQTKLNYYGRKLPRINMRKEVRTSEGDAVIVLNFNYEYMAVEHKKSMLQKDKIFIPVDEHTTIELVKVKELDYYELKEEEKTTMQVSLYRIVNVDDVIEFENITSYMMQFKNEFIEKLREEELMLKKKNNIKEYDELELL